MKFKILRTIIIYLGLIILSYAVYLKTGIQDGLAIFGAMLIASSLYIWIEYDDDGNKKK